MRIKFCIPAIIACVSLSRPSFAVEAADNKALVILSEKSEIFENEFCKKRGTCDLIRAEFIVEDYKIAITESDYNYGTRLIARYETESVEALENYVFVGFIKGCVFIRDAITGKTMYKRRNFFGKEKDFIHAKWEIDSEDEDPAYWSVVEANQPRDSYYLWNSVRKSVDHRTQRTYGETRPDFPELYVTDHPGGQVFATESISQNISLQLEMCIYKEDDVPVSAEPDDIRFAKPLYCFPWQSSFVYDNERGTFEQPREIARECR